MRVEPSRLFPALLVLLGSCAAEPPAPRRELPPAPLTVAPSASAEVVREAPVVSSDAGPGAQEQGSRPLDRAALDRLVADARATESDDLVVIKDGELVGDWNFSGRRVPIQTMSITKSVLSLLAGILIDAGKLRLDQPVHDFYPDWRNGEKSKVTVLHLLSHNSGLEEGKTSAPIYASKNFIDFTLRSKLLYEPGTHYEYSNRATNLLSGVIAKAARMPTDRYAAQVLFQPLGIKRYEWQKDRAGNAQGLAGLKLLARDLAKIGELVLTQGSWQGQRVVSEGWIAQSTLTSVPVQPTNKRLALLWWLLPDWTRVTIDEGVVSAWRGAGTDEAFIARVAPVTGRTFTSVPAFVQALRELFGDEKLVEWGSHTYDRGLPDARFEFGPIVGTYAAGTLGQYLVILPRDRLVVVRLRRSPERRSTERTGQSTIDRTFPDFIERARQLVLTQLPRNP
jgi:CubicO group peptidase (beta-lactamase class C family)